MDVRVRGAEDLERVAKQLKVTGNGDLRKELLRGIRESAKPTVSAIKRNAAAQLPKGGGLAAQVSKSRIGIRTRTSGKSAGVRIEAKHPYNIRGMDRGFLRHPVFGNREVWVNQEIASGWFSEPIEKDLPQIREGVIQAMDDVAKKIASKA